VSVPNTDTNRISPSATADVPRTSFETDIDLENSVINSENSGQPQNNHRMEDFMYNEDKSQGESSFMDENFEDQYK
jgi:hypothetical protein